VADRDDAPKGRREVLDLGRSRTDYAALIPWRYSDWSLGTIGQRALMKIKEEVETLSGVKFKIRDFRSTFGQADIDRKAPTPSVSKAMRHYPRGRGRTTAAYL
jgi:hypothetical protein